MTKGRHTCLCDTLMTLTPRHEQDIQEQARRFVVFKAELEDKQRRLVRFENVQEVGVF